MKSKAVIIALLLVVNLCLLAALVLSVVESRPVWAGIAKAQAMPGSPRYLMVTGRFRENNQAVYVVSLETRMLAAFTFDQGSKRIRYNGRISLGSSGNQR